MATIPATVENPEPRISRALSLRLKRTSSHIKEFYKLNVSLAAGTNLVVMIDKEQTIEFLAKEIEAQCAYGSLKPGQEVNSGNPPLIMPIEQIYDGGMLALRFSDRVCDVLEFNDTVYAISSGEDATARVFSYTAPMAGPSRILGARDGPTASAGSMTNSLDDRLSSVFHNKLGIRAFVEFCMEEFTIENLPLYLDVEIFRSLSGEMCQHYGNYIYYTYIAVESPLEINISADTRADIPVPAEGVEPSELQFDEAQEQVYAMLRNHSFLRFEKSQKYANVRRSGHYDQAAFSEPFSDVFQPNLKTIAVIVKAVLDARTIASSIPPNPSAIPELGSVLFKESVLPQVLSHLFPYMNTAFSGYFDDHKRSEWSEKQRAMQKKKKLSKFFGERPPTDQMQRQPISSPGTRRRDSWLTPPDRLDRESSETSLLPKEEDFDEGGSSNVQRRKKLEKLETIFGDRLPNRERRVQQIVTHGYTPSISLFEAEPFSSGLLSLYDDQELIPAESTNALEPGKRRILQRRTKKLSTMLGESLDEKTISKTVTKALVIKRNSITYFASSLSTASIATLPPASGTVKLSHKRSLDKISALLGEPIGVDHLQEAQATASLKGARPLTQEEKKQFRKKATKLERLLGKLPPPEHVIAYSSLPRSAETFNPASADALKAHRSILSFAFVIGSAKVMVDIVETVAGVNEDEPPPSPSFFVARSSPIRKSRSFDSIDAFTRAKVTRTISVVEPNEKESRQRRLNKLRRFFGEGVSVATLIEQQIRAELEKTVADKIDDQVEERTVLSEDT
ncbi:hypothetical protein BDK51DRAFT_29674 [Blyttiomyces helicus]|uniref:RGS domain-containing protein n=1 Tax=Blyttiomyces helicus TaxID=388810 RepID=A0A4V1IST2_9FUNG|nr:hypothetical protein BDK51DRAFT_29674 [Blyttiomyces helicus]|eukprot:RKO94647.1 hypothetical protein BDK51DRAFT_29674 [Blyttiomyces helicus]